MKTDDLIKLLATGVEAVEPHAVERRYAKAVGLGLMAAAVLMAKRSAPAVRLPPSTTATSG